MSISTNNNMPKFADDSNVLVLENTDVDVSMLDELTGY
jgi:hypothetical protein